MRVRRMSVGVFAVACFGAGTIASAQNYTFVKITDNSGALSTFGVPALNNARQAAFRAARDVGGAGMYAGSGGAVTTIADDDGPYVFNGFGGFPSINDGGTVAFDSFLDLSAGDGQGVFTGSGGAVATVASTSGAPFSTFFGGPSINAAGAVAFGASLDAGGQGSFRRDDGGGPITTIAQTGATFSSFGGSSLNAAATVAFRANLTAGGAGIFAGSGGAVTTIVDSSGTFAGVGSNPTINADGTVAFYAFNSIGVEGLYTGNGGAVATVVDSSGPFASFGFSTINADGTVAFFATLDAGGPGIFTGDDPVADKVIRAGDALFGSTVTGLNFFRGLNDNGDIAFQYELANGQTGIAVAAIPEPGTAGVLAIAGLCTLSRRRRTRMISEGGTR